MRNDVILYEKVYTSLKNKIECGLLPGGARLPSRANMCMEFGVSEKTVRRAVELLVQDGLVETTQRKRPTVACNRNIHQTAALALQRADAAAANDVMKTGILLCYPLISRGIALCGGADWDIPDTILERMDPLEADKFWRLSNRFWRFFVARLGNLLILRAVDSLGFSDLKGLLSDFERRSRYLANLKEFLRTVKNGGSPDSVPFEDMSGVYGLPLLDGAPPYRVPPDSVFRVGAKGLEERLRRSEERYSSVYMDLLGQIAIGRYKPGERLPCHKELQKIYGVSIDTTLKAVKALQDCGVVTAAPHKGIVVAMGLDGLQQIQLDPKLIACHVRRLADSLELLSLTVEGVAAHAAERITPEDARRLRAKLERQWRQPRQYQLVPGLLLSFLNEHIQHEALRSIYELLRKNFGLGRRIPDLVSREKNEKERVLYTKCQAAVDALEDGDARRFARQTAELFHNVHVMIFDECSRLGYWEAAMRVYDGTTLWT